MKHAIIFATLAMTLMPAHGSECTYTGADVGYAHCTTPEQKAHAFKSFCEDVDGAKGAYNEREDCARSLHPTCIYTDDPIVWRGQVVSEVFMNGRADGTGREYPKRYTAIIPERKRQSL
jgi:hypothetical protein